MQPNKNFPPHIKGRPDDLSGLPPPVAVRLRLAAIVLLQTLLILSGLSVIGYLNYVGGQSSHSSSNYRVEESFMGDGGATESSSPNYIGQESIGATAVGDTSSTNYQAQAGATTTNDPSLSFLVNTSAVNLGALSTASTATGTSTFSVLNYTSHGYVVMTTGAPPTNNNYTIAGMNPAGASQTGTEQYGINLKANTSPTSFGSEPVQVPSSSFSYGEAAPNYNTANNYRYVAGETIARATKSSGRTDFTISYIVNVATTTAGGQYRTNQDLICIGTY